MLKSAEGGWKRGLEAVGSTGVNWLLLMLIIVVGTAWSFIRLPLTCWLEGDDADCYDGNCIGR